MTIQQRRRKRGIHYYNILHHDYSQLARMIWLILLLATGNGDGRTMNCDDLQGELIEETSSIQSCNEDFACGQPFVPTIGCGCTRNRVARLDADLSTYQQIRDEMSLVGCPTVPSICDCPMADGFLCLKRNESDSVGTCIWNLTNHDYQSTASDDVPDETMEPDLPPQNTTMPPVEDCIDKDRDDAATSTGCNYNFVVVSFNNRWYCIDCLLLTFFAF